MNDKWKHLLVDAAIIIAIIACVLAAFSMMAEANRAEEAAEHAERVVAASMEAYFRFRADTLAAQPEYDGQADESHAEYQTEDHMENEKIEAGLVEQGYYRDDVPLSYELQDFLQTACSEFGIRHELALAVIETETGFNNLVGDNGNSIGYFQIQPRWCGALMAEIGVTDLTEPYQNFRTGCAILRQWLDKYGNERDALTAFNSGHPGESAYAASVLKMAEKWIELE